MFFTQRKKWFFLEFQKFMINSFWNSVSYMLFYNFSLVAWIKVVLYFFCFKFFLVLLCGMVFILSFFKQKPIELDLSTVNSIPHKNVQNKSPVLKRNRKRKVRHPVKRECVFFFWKTFIIQFFIWKLNPMIKNFGIQRKNFWNNLNLKPRILIGGARILIFSSKLSV